MVGQIRMTPETMRQRAGEVRAQGEAFQDVINRMQHLIDELQSEWEGNASQEFARQFDTLKPSFIETKQLIDDIGQQLDGTADSVEALDDEIARKFKR